MREVDLLRKEIKYWKDLVFKGKSMFTISKKFEVPYAHRLMNHLRDCKYLHGHNAILEVFISSPDLDKMNMVLDFSDFKKVVGEWLKENWDHCVLLNENDRDILDRQFSVDIFKKVYLFKGNPTAELMAKELYVVVQGLMVKHKIPVQVSKVICWETLDSYAEYSPENDLTKPEEEL